MPVPAPGSSMASTAAGDRLKVTGSISARNGCAPARRMELTEAKKLNGVVMTGSFPGRARQRQWPARGRQCRTNIRWLGHAQLGGRSLSKAETARQE